MSANDPNSDDGYYKDTRIGRTPQPGDDDISPWKYYGTIAFVILIGAGVILSLFFA